VETRKKEKTAVDSSFQGFAGDSQSHFSFMHLAYTTPSRAFRCIFKRKKGVPILAHSLN
jgi:hypothetical protein